jgi:glycosyltransferase involved in cell wall biosynthesis
MRVIFLSRFTGYDKDIDVFRPGTDAFYYFGMGQFIASEFYARNYPVIFENWRMDLRIDSVVEKDIDGMLCRIFPAKRIKGFGEYSKEIVQALKKESGKENVLFHFMPNHPLNYHYFARLLKYNKIVATHIGGSNPYWKYKNEGRWGSLLYYFLEKYYFLKFYDHFVTMCKPEADYYARVKKPVSHMPPFGISREHLFVIKNRDECRKKLGMPLNKKILLQVGRANRNRGFDWIMDLIDHYQMKNDYFLVFAGVHHSSEYYRKLIDKGCFVAPFLPHKELVDYYNAADLLYYLPHDSVDINFAGTSYVPLEALACGTPVVATTFHHFPGDEVGEVSRIPQSKKDVIPMIENLLTANVSRERCREIVLKHFSWDKVIEKHWEIYNK